VLDFLPLVGKIKLRDDELVPLGRRVVVEGLGAAADLVEVPIVIGLQPVLGARPL
jgi:hypothetical protein